MTKATFSGISIQSVLLWLPNGTDQVPWPTIVNIFIIFFLFFCFFDGNVTTSLFNCLLEVSVDDIFSQVDNIYAYIHAHILKYIRTPTHLHKFLPTIHYSCRLAISSYHKSYQQYFDNSLNYKKLEKFIAIKRKK